MDQPSEGCYLIFLNLDTYVTGIQSGLPGTPPASGDLVRFDDIDSILVSLGGGYCEDEAVKEAREYVKYVSRSLHVENATQAVDSYFDNLDILQEKSQVPGLYDKLDDSSNSESVHEEGGRPSSRLDQATGFGHNDSDSSTYYSEAENSHPRDLPDPQDYEPQVFEEYSQLF